MYIHSNLATIYVMITDHVSMTFKFIYLNSYIKLNTISIKIKYVFNLKDYEKTNSFRKFKNYKKAVIRIYFNNFKLKKL